MKIGIIGSGSWGTALACKSAQAGNEAWLYCRREEQATRLKSDRENKEYLAGVVLPENLKISHVPAVVAENSDILLIVTPSIYVRDTLKQFAPYISEKTTVVICSKGIERETGKRLSEVADEVVGHITEHLAILSGPNHAEEIGRDLPAATVVAARTVPTAEQVQQALSTVDFRVYVNEDMTGVELAATTKNIIALAAGIADGMKLGDNCNYYWLRKIRKEAYEQMSSINLPATSQEGTVTFAELPVQPQGASESFGQSFQADAIIRTGKLTIGLSNTVSPGLLKQMLEVVIHVS